MYTSSSDGKLYLHRHIVRIFPEMNVNIKRADDITVCGYGGGVRY